MISEIDLFCYEALKNRQSNEFTNSTFYWLIYVIFYIDI